MITYEALVKELRNKIYRPVYFLMGDESYYIDKITDYFEIHILSEEERDFNLTILYGKETSVEEIIHVSRRFPMMTQYQVVIVKEAQQLRQLDKLSVYTASPQDTTILVFAYKNGTYDKRKKLLKDIDKKYALFVSNKLKDRQLPDWVRTYLKQKDKTITEKGLSMLVEFLGADLSKMVNELDKLILLLEDEKNITEQHIEDNIGISKDYNIFELQKAIGQRNHRKANLIAQYFSQNPNQHPFVVTVTMVFQYFTKLLLYKSLAGQSDRRSLAADMGVNPYFLDDYAKEASHYHIEKIKENISILREYDLKSKGVDSVDVSSGELLKEMIFRLMN